MSLFFIASISCCSISSLKEFKNYATYNLVRLRLKTFKVQFHLLIEVLVYHFHDHGRYVGTFVHACVHTYVRVYVRTYVRAYTR